MHFLDLMDEKKRDFTAEKNILDKNGYYYYCDVKFNKEVEEGISVKFQFIKVGTLSIVMINPTTGIKMYLSDYDIITLLIELCRENLGVAKKIFAQMELVIMGSGNDFEFAVDSEWYKCKGIYLEENLEVCIDTPMDISINIYDFITLLNLIIEKERYASDVEGTLGKYIAISVYYAEILDGDKQSKLGELLKGYEVNTAKDVSYNKWIITRDRQHKLLINYDEVIKCCATI